LAKKQLISAAESSGCFKRIEIASRRTVDSDTFDAIYSSYNNGLEQSKADLVYVSLVNSEHYTWVKQSLMSGRHTIVDKPAFLNQSEALELCTLAASKDLLLAEATVWTQHPQIDRMLSLFRNSESAVSKAVALFSMPPFSADNFRWQKDLGGGALYDLGPYFASTGRVLFGGSARNVKATILSHDNEVPLSFSAQATWPCGGSLVGHFGFDTEYINRLEALNAKMHVSLNRAFTTPQDLENTLHISRGSIASSEVCDAGNSFTIFFKKISTDINNDLIQHWHQNLLDDSRTLAQLYVATKEEEL
jgi:predicted dehydrogenase